MEKKVYLFGKQGCGLCQGWKKKLENFNINFQYLDIENPDNLAEFTLMGLTKVPALVIGEIKFEGVRPSDITIEEIKKMIEGKNES
ncbi:MAG: glutaredoxin family protein [Candidatus Omnitrophica bacterium]|nr:glutaredoxin family protein [Candidatus Omnitrophota bacterium]MCM8816102.1 glutaredoxin family protein [Candidatus Omnitrophota bacterium]